MDKLSSTLMRQLTTASQARDLSDEQVDALDALKKMPSRLSDMLTSLKMQTMMQRSQMSIASFMDVRTLYGQPRVDYNKQQPRASHRVSKERYACVLNYAPAIEGFNYLPPRDGDAEQSALLRTNSQVAHIWNRKHLVLLARNGYLGEDAAFIDLLSNNGRGGFQLYAFNVQWGAQVDGGCFEARKKSGMPSVMYGRTA